MTEYIIRKNGKVLGTRQLSRGQIVKLLKQDYQVEPAPWPQPGAFMRRMNIAQGVIGFIILFLILLAVLAVGRARADDIPDASLTPGVQRQLSLEKSVIRNGASIAAWLRPR